MASSDNQEFYSGLYPDAKYSIKSVCFKTVQVQRNVLSFQKQKKIGGILSMPIYTWREGTKNRARLFSVVLNVQRVNGHKLEHMRICLNIRKNLFTVCVMEHLNKLPRGCRVCLGDGQKPSAHCLGQPAVGVHAWAGELDQVTSRVPFESQPFCECDLSFNAKSSITS